VRFSYPVVSHIVETVKPCRLSTLCLETNRTTRTANWLIYQSTALRPEVAQKTSRLEQTRRPLIPVNLIFMDPCIVVWIGKNNQQDATLILVVLHLDANNSSLFTYNTFIKILYIHAQGDSINMQFNHIRRIYLKCYH
jgi:hypothetical protein